MAPKGSDLFKWADHYRLQGLCVIPLRSGKLPAVAWKEFQARRSERFELMKWFAGGTGWGMAIVCGKVSGNLVRIDFDNPDDYKALRADLPEAPTFRSQRPGGGYGLLVRATDAVPTLPQKTFKDYPELEVRGEGSITVVPPTPGYSWLSSPDDIPVLDVAKLLKQLTGFDLSSREQLASSVSESADNDLAALLRETAEGERSNNLVKIAGMLRARGIDRDTAVQVMEVNFEEHWPHDGMDWDEARRIFEGAWDRYAHEGVRVTGRKTGGAVADEDEDDEGVEAMFIEDIKPSKDSGVLIDRLVLSGEAGNTVIAAPTKMGKTSLILDACITATRGDPVWGALAVSKPIKVAYIDQERKFHQIAENQELMSTVTGHPAPRHLLILAQKTGQFQVDRRKALQELEEKLLEFMPDLIVIDGWGWFVGHRESDPDYVRPAMAWIKKERQVLRCASIIIHHFKKKQYAGGREQSDATDLDNISGLKRLSDQAQTSLVYVQVPGYDTFNLLTGKTNRYQWDPPKIVIDYDHTTLTHRMVQSDEGMELFDPDTYRELWGKESTESRRLKGMLNTIRNLKKWNQVELAEALGVDKSQVSRWYSGRQKPSEANMQRIADLHKAAKQRPKKADKMPKGGN